MTTRHRAPNGRFIAERTTQTTTTCSVTERLTIEHHEADDTAPIAWAPGFRGPQLTRHDYLAQRYRQVQRCLDHLAVWDESAPPGTELPESWLREAVTILRAGPGATSSELEYGRSA